MHRVHNRPSSAILALAVALAMALGVPPLAALAGGQLAAGLGRLTGTVRDADTEAVLAAATVRAYADAAEAGSAQTGADGTYSLDLPAGEYTLKATAANHRAAFYETDDAQGDPVSSVTIADGQVLDGIDFALTGLGSLSGLVRAGDTGLPVSGVVVKLFPPASSDPNPVATATTDASGAYTLSDVAAGTYVIQFDAAGTDYRSIWWQQAATKDAAKAVLVATGDHLVGYDATLQLGAKISGTVRNADGAAVQAAWVCTSADYSWAALCATSDSSGHYVIRGIPAGQYSLVVAASGYVTTYYGDVTMYANRETFSVPESAEVTGKDVVVSRGSSISGTVTDELGAPVASVQVCASLTSSACATSSSTGTYTIGSLAAGSYWVSTTRDGSLDAGTRLALGENQARTGVDLVLTAAGSVSGTVTLGDFDGSGHSVFITLTDLEGHYVTSTSVYASTSTTQYELPKVAAGTYDIMFQSWGYADQWYDGAADQADATSIAVTKGQKTPNVDVTLERSPTAVTSATAHGVVTDDTGAPLAGAEVYVSYDNGYRYLTTGSDGSFGLGVPAGSLYVAVWNVSGHLSYSGSFSVEDGEDKDLGTLVVPREAVITGKAIGGNDGRTPLSGVSVTLLDSNNYTTASTTTAADGTYRLGGLAKGYYRLRFEYGETGVTYYLRAHNLTDATFVRARTGQTVTLDDVVLQRTASASGTVSDPGGAPLKGATVVAYSTEADVVGTVNTDRDGGFTLGGLAPGTYTFLASPPSGSSDMVAHWWSDSDAELGAVPVNLEPGGSVSGINFSLGGRAAAVLEGTVTDTLGRPVADGIVQLETSEGDSVVTTRTDTAGHYRLGTETPGLYLAVFGTGNDLSWWPAGADFAGAIPVELTVGTSRTADFTVAAAGSLRATVTTPDGSGFSGWAELVEAGNFYEYWDSYDTTTNTFTFSRVLPGDYILSVWDDSGTYALNQRPVTVTAGGTVEETVAVVPGRSISGHLTVDGETPESYSYEVCAVDADKVSLTCGWVGSDGSYRITQLPPGDYALRIDSEDNENAFGWYGGADFTSATRVAVGDTNLTDVEIAIDSPPPVLSPVDIAVVLPATVAATPENYARVTGTLTSGDAEPIPLVMDTATGHLRGTDIPNGWYELEVAAPDLHLIGYSDEIGVWGDTVETISLRQMATLSGRVILPEGMDTAGNYATVTITATLDNDDDEGEDEAASIPVPIDSSGNFSVMLEPGWYWLDAQTSLPVVLHDRGLEVDGATTIDIVGRLAYTVSGRILPPAGLGADLDYSNCWGSLSNLNPTNADDDEDYNDLDITAEGTYTARVEAGSYTLYLSCGAGTLGLEQNVQIDADTVLDLQLVASGTIEGDLVDEFGTALSGWVSWTRQGAADDTVDSSFDNSGIHVDGLAAGTYELVIHPNGGYAAIALAGNDAVTVGEGETVQLGTLQAGLGGRVTGRIADVGGPSWIRIVVTDLAGVELGSTSVYEGGSYSVGGLPAGEALVRFEQDGDAPEWWRDASSAAQATPVTIVAGEATGKISPRLHALAEDGAITGKVTTQFGSATAVLVTVVDADGDEVTNARPYGEGSYWFNLKPGTYKVRVDYCTEWGVSDEDGEDCVGEYLQQWWPGTADQEAGTRIVVGSGRTVRSIDFAISGGTAFDTVGTPAISGTPVVGGTLTATPGTWAPTGATFTYQWLADGSPIDDATGTTLVLTSDQVGKRIAVLVTAQLDGRVTTTAASAATDAVLAGILPGAVMVSGSATVGSTLTGSTTAWDPANTALAYQWLRGGEVIIAATQATYTVTSADVGYRLSLRVTGSLAGYTSVTATSDPTDAVPGGTFAGPGTATITGTPKVGALLTASASGWSPEPTGLGYQWALNGSAIDGADQSTYRVRSADVGGKLTVAVTALRDGYTPKTATSAATAAVAAGTLASDTPTVNVPTGGPKVDQELQALPGTWGPDGVTLTYRWYRVSSTGKSSTIADATEPSYSVQPFDVGYRLKVSVTGALDGYTPVTKTSSVTAAVAKAAFTAWARPQITMDGPTARVGKVLTAQPGVATPAATGYTYQWYRGTSAISGAKGATYTLTSADLGRTVKVRVAATRAGYTTSAGLDSDPTATVQAGLKPVTPRLDDITPTVDQVVSVLPATDYTAWGPVPVTPHYQWYRGSTPIADTDRASYRVQPADAGKTIKVVLSGSADDYGPVSAGSASSKKVTKASLTTIGQPTLDVTAPRVDGSVTVDPGMWGPSPVDFTYQWYKVNSSKTLSALKGATSATYVVDGSVVGYRLTVKVTSVKDGYNAAAKYAATTSVVPREAFATTGDPTVSIDGTPRVGKTAAATPGTFAPEARFSFQWYRGTSAISKATAARYTLTSSDLGKLVSVKVTATRSGYTTVVGTATLAGPVIAGLTGVTPKLTTTAPAVGTEIGIRTGTGFDAWSPTVTPGYQWYSGGVPVDGAIKATYTVQPGDAGRTISVKLTGSADDYAPLTIASAVTAKATKINFAARGAVSISVDGAVLTASIDTDWSPDPDGHAYQWYRNGKAISKATNATCTATSSGSYTVKVTASRLGYNSSSVTSAARTVTLP